MNFLTNALMSAAIRSVSKAAYQYVAEQPIRLLILSWRLKNPEFSIKVYFLT